MNSYSDRKKKISFVFSMALYGTNIVKKNYFYFSLFCELRSFCLLGKIISFTIKKKLKILLESIKKLRENENNYHVIVIHYFFTFFLKRF